MDVQVGPVTGDTGLDGKVGGRLVRNGGNEVNDGEEEEQGKYDGAVNAGEGVVKAEHHDAAGEEDVEGGMVHKFCVPDDGYGAVHVVDEREDDGEGAGQIHDVDDAGVAGECSDGLYADDVRYVRTFHQ